MTNTTAPRDTTAADERVMGMLQQHVPLSLLADLLDPLGPESETILDTEGQPDTAWWEPRR